MIVSVLVPGLGLVSCSRVSGSGGATAATPRVLSLDCQFVDEPGSLRIFTAAAVPPSKIHHEPLEGSYVLVRRGRTSEGRFRGERHRDYDDLSLTLDSGHWLSTQYNWSVDGGVKEPIDAGLQVPNEGPLTLACKGPLAIGPSSLDP